MLSPTSRFHAHHHHRRRQIFGILSLQKTLFLLIWTLLFAAVFFWLWSDVNDIGIRIMPFRRRRLPRPCPRLRPVVFNLTDFGGVGNGRTLNTEAFSRAIEAISKLQKKGGGQLNVQPGVWLTCPFNLTSHMTLFLAEESVILGST